ncbi:MAG: group I truncated hemoglobin [Archangium sp.]
MNRFIIVSLLALAGCATESAARSESKTTTAATKPDETPNKPLFERLGGKPAIEAVIDDFLGRVGADERINSGFAVGHLPRLRQRLIELVCAATGGPCTYSGRDMTTAHAGMKITNEQFDALVGHLVATLDKFKVPDREKGELLGLLGPMRSQIVEE